jgi:hypothetical protein
MTAPLSSDLIGAIPFAVYGLGDDYSGPRCLGGVGRNRETIDLVTLEHGDRTDPARPWVQVTVTGPLHGAYDPMRSAYSWSMDPLPMVAGELLNADGANFPSSEELQEAIADVLAREPETVELLVDGRPTPFHVWRQRESWAAVGDLIADHMLYVIGCNADPASIELSSGVDIRRYVQPPGA